MNDSWRQIKRVKLSLVTVDCFQPSTAYLMNVFDRKNKRASEDENVFLLTKPIKIYSFFKDRHFLTDLYAKIRK